MLVWPGWTTDCCFMVSGARPRVIGLLEAWGDSVGLQGEHKSVSQKLVSLGPSLQLYGRWTHCSVDSNTVVMNGRVDFPKKRLAHQWPGSALGRPERSKGGSGCCHPSGVLSLSTLPPPPTSGCELCPYAGRFCTHPGGGARCPQGTLHFRRSCCWTRSPGVLGKGGGSATRL